MNGPVSQILIQTLPILVGAGVMYCIMKVKPSEGKVRIYVDNQWSKAQNNEEKSSPLSRHIRYLSEEEPERERNFTDLAYDTLLMNGMLRLPCNPSTIKISAWKGLGIADIWSITELNLIANPPPAGSTIHIMASTSDEIISRVLRFDEASGRMLSHAVEYNAASGEISW